MPKDFTAPSQQWNIQDQINQSKIYNQQDEQNTIKKIQEQQDFNALAEKEQKAWNRLKDYEAQGYDMSMHYDKFKTIGADSGKLERAYNGLRKYTSEGATTLSDIFGEDNSQYKNNIREIALRENNWKQRQSDLNPNKYKTKEDVWNVSGGLGEAAPYVAGGYAMGASKAPSLLGKIAGDVGRGAVADTYLGALQHGYKDNFDSELAKEVGFGVAGQAVGTGIAHLLSKAGVDSNAVLKPTQKVDNAPTENIIKPNNSQDDIAAKINKANFGDINTIQPEVQARSDMPKVDNITSPIEKKDYSPYIFENNSKPISKLPDALPLNDKEEMKSIIRYAKDNDAVDEFISKLPQNARVDEVQKFFDNLKPTQIKEDGIIPVTTNKKEPIKNYNISNLQEFEGLTKATGNNTADVLSLSAPTSTSGVRNAIERYMGGTASQRDIEILDAVENFMKYEGDNFRQKVGVSKPDTSMKIDDAIRNNIDYKTADANGAIPFSNGTQTFGGASVGGLESEFNQRDYNNDGKHDYKDNIYGVIVGALGINAAKKLFPKAFKDENLNSDVMGAFVSKADKQEKRGIYNVTFNGKNSSQVKKYDLETLNDFIKYENGNSNKGAIHIQKHLEDGSAGEVSKDELLNIGEVIRNGELHLEDGKNIYTLFKEDGTRLRAVTGNKGKEKVITFYSDRNIGRGGIENSTLLQPTNNKTIISKDADKIKRDENFKKWFKGSQVVDKNGEPLVVYHGTNALFDTFSNDKINKTNGMEYGVGFYFTPDINYAKQFGNPKEFYINSKKPFQLIDGKGLVASVESKIGFSNKEYKEMKKGGKYKEREVATKVLKNSGYDSVISENEITVFEPTQIKSIHNKGTFDGNNPNVLMASPTISGGLVGGVTGAISDLDGDGKITYKDIAIGALGGAGLTKGALIAKNSQRIARAVETFKSNENVNAIYGFNINKATDYLKLRDDVLKATNQKMEQFSLLHEQLKLLDTPTRNAMYDYMSGKNVQLSQTIKSLADNYINEVDKLSKELVDLGVLDAAQFDKFKGRYLHRRYEKDFMQKFTSLFSKGKTVQGIQSRGREWTGSAAEYNRMLANNEIGDFFQGKVEATQMRNGQYKFRQDWTDEQRARWGEVKDIAFSLPETLMRSSEMVQHATFLKRVLNETGYVLDDATDGYVQLNGKKYGALNGKYVRKDIASDVNEFNQALFGKESDGFSKDFMDTLKSFVSYWKKTHTVYNPVAHWNNLFSNITMQFGAGLNPIKAVANAKRGYEASSKMGLIRQLEAKKIIGLSNEETNTLNNLLQDSDIQLWKQASEAGLFGRSKLNDVLMKYIKPSTNNSSFMKQGLLGKIDEKVSAAYQAEDDIMRYSVLKSFLEQGMDFDTAVSKVSTVIPDYTKPMSYLARKMRDTGIAPFISWTYHATPIILNQMKEHPERVAAIYGALYGINQLMGIDPFNEKDIPQQNFSMKRIPIYKDGNEVTTIKVDRWIPHNDIMNPGDFIKNLLSPGIYTPLIEIPINQNLHFGGKITHNEGALKAYDLTKHALSQVTPDALDKLASTAESLIASKNTRTKNPVVQPRSTLQELINLIGFNSITYNKANQARKVSNEKIK